MTGRHAQNFPLQNMPAAWVFPSPGEVIRHVGQQVRKFRLFVMAAISAKAGEAEAPALSREARARFQSQIVPHLDPAYNFACYLSRDPDAANDIVQDAFLRAYRGFEQFRGGDAKAWLLAIVRNSHRAWYNENRRKAKFETKAVAGDEADEDPIEKIASDADTPEMSVLRSSVSRSVRAVIANLPEAMREILILRELEDMSYRQIADILDIPVGTVMSRIARARAEFQREWDEFAKKEARP